jgi:hypothetical protein
VVLRHEQKDRVGIQSHLSPDSFISGRTVVKNEKGHPERLRPFFKFFQGSEKPDEKHLQHQAAAAVIESSLPPKEVFIRV